MDKIVKTFRSVNQKELCNKCGGLINTAEAAYFITCGKEVAIACYECNKKHDFYCDTFLDKIKDITSLEMVKYEVEDFKRSAEFAKYKLKCADEQKLLHEEIAILRGNRTQRKKLDLFGTRRKNENLR